MYNMDAIASEGVIIPFHDGASHKVQMEPTASCGQEFPVFGAGL